MGRSDPSATQIHGWLIRSTVGSKDICARVGAALQDLAEDLEAASQIVPMGNRPNTHTHRVWHVLPSDREGFGARYQHTSLFSLTHAFIAPPWLG